MTNAINVTDKEHDAIFAALRLLQEALESGEVSPNDGGVGEVLTCGGGHEGLTSDDIEELIDREMA